MGLPDLWELHDPLTTPFSLLSSVDGRTKTLAYLFISTCDLPRQRHGLSVFNISKIGVQPPFLLRQPAGRASSPVVIKGGQ